MDFEWLPIIIYKLRLVTLQLLPLMYLYKINDIMFFIKFTRNNLHISTSLNIFNLGPLIHDLVHPKRWSITDIPPALLRTFTFIVSLPKTDLSLSTNIIKHKLYNFMWDHFIQQFNDSNVHTFHYLCPYCHCSTLSPSPLYAVL